MYSVKDTSMKRLQQKTKEQIALLKDTSLEKVIVGRDEHGYSFFIHENGNWERYPLFFKCKGLSLPLRPCLKIFKFNL